MNNLSRKEIKAILIVHKRANYGNIVQIKESYSILTERGILISPKAVEYGERLREIAEGNPDIRSCVMCGKEASGEKGVICDTCEALLNGLVSGEIVNSDGMVPSKPADLSENAEDSGKNTKNGKPENGKTKKEKPKKEKADKKKSEKEKVRKEKVKKEKKPLDLRIGKKLVLASIAVVIITLGLDIYGLVSTKLMHKKVVRVVDEAIMKLVEGEVSSEDIGEKASNVSAEKLDTSDLFKYLGSNYQILADSLGQSQPVVVENVRFFEAKGITVVYDEHNNRITYIDLNSTADSTILGICPGMNRNRVIKQLGSFGITEPSKKDGDTYFYYLSNEEANFKASLTVTYDKGNATLVAVQFVD